MNISDISLINNEESHSFELWVNEHRAFIDYKKSGSIVYFLHTEVPQEISGQGVAAVLVEKALTYLEQNALKLVPLCPYTQTFLKRHPEWNRLVISSN